MSILEILHSNQLAKALENNTTLKSIDLSYRHMGENIRAYPDNTNEAALDILAKALNTTQITSLNLEGNSIGLEGAKTMALLLETNQRLTELNLNNNFMNGTVGAVLGAGLKNNKTLTSLSLGNSISRQGASAIIDALENNQTLKHLDLENAGIVASEDFKKLMIWLKANTT